MKKHWICALMAAVLIAGLFSGAAPRSRAAEAMTTSQQMIDVLKKMEGFARRAYWDYSQWTVGYGTRCPNDMLGEYDAETGRDITVAEAEALLREMLTGFEDEVNRLIRKYDLVLSQNEFDALVSITYNCGGAWTRNDGAILNMAVRSGATGTDLIYAMCLYSKVDTDYALVSRRLSEAYMYLEGGYEAYNTGADGTYPESYRYVYLDGNGGNVHYAIHGYDGADGAAPNACFTSVPTGTDSQGESFVYSFAGWYTARSGGSRVDALDGSLPNGTVLYAHWADPSGQTVELNVGTPAEGLTATAGSRINVRTGPGTFFAKSGVLDAGVTVTVTEYCTRDSLIWGKYDGGWICLNYTDFEEPADAASRGSVTGVTLVAPPDAQTCVQGQAIPRLQGAVLQISYSDGSVGATGLTTDMIAHFDSDSLGQTTVTAEYAGYAVTFPLTVVEPTVTYLDEDGAVLGQESCPLGQTLTPPQISNKTAEDGTERAFLGWSPEVGQCRGSRSYTAVFAQPGQSAPDTTEPDTTEPDTTEPDATEPEATEPEQPELEDPSENQPKWPRVGLITGYYVNARVGAGTSYDTAGYYLNVGDLVVIHQVVYDGTEYNWGLMADGNWVCMDFVDLLGTGSDTLSGDVNGDGRVDKDDAIYLLRYVVFPDKYPINTNCDVNADGTIDKDDAIYLLRHVVFPDKYPLRS